MLIRDRSKYECGMVPVLQRTANGALRPGHERHTLSAAFTRSGVNGTVRSRTPVAS
jgi:hypothetical protein